MANQSKKARSCVRRAIAQTIGGIEGLQEAKSWMSRDARETLDNIVEQALSGGTVNFQFNVNGQKADITDTINTLLKKNGITKESLSQEKEQQAQKLAMQKASLAAQEQERRITQEKAPQIAAEEAQYTSMPDPQEHTRQQARLARMEKSAIKSLTHGEERTFNNTPNIEPDSPYGNLDAIREAAKQIKEQEAKAIYDELDKAKGDRQEEAPGNSKRMDKMVEAADKSLRGQKRSWQETKPSPARDASRKRPRLLLERGAGLQAATDSPTPEQTPGKNKDESPGR